MGKKFDYDKMKIKVEFKDDKTFEEQLAIVNKVNDCFIEIATTYHVNKIKDKMKEKKN